MIESWQTKLKEFVAPRTMFVGIGNRLRGDDAFGPLLIERLPHESRWPSLDVGETPENFIEKILSEQPEHVLFLDAVKWGAAPGEIGFFPAEDIPWSGISTHCASLRLFSDLLHARGDCVSAFLGPQPKSTEFCESLSDEVAESVVSIATFLTEL